MDNRFCILIFDEATHKIEYDFEIMQEVDILDSVINICKELISNPNNKTNEIWIFDNITLLNVAKVYKTIDNKIYVKCYATL